MCSSTGAWPTGAGEADDLNAQGIDRNVGLGIRVRDGWKEA